MQMGLASRKPAWTHLDGVLLIDKPVGPSSSRVLGHVKHLLGAKKAGHGGTLDPMASGLLPIMLGESTKFAAEGLDADKRYLAEILLGVSTDTGDQEGEVIERAAVSEHDAPDAAAVRAVLERFMGQQMQTPPMHSAIKKDGKALYAYAREGKDVQRTPREITIHAIDLVHLALPVLTVDVSCSKGTYIRTLAQDIGKSLGFPASLKSLRRIGVGSIAAHDMVPLETLEHADLNERRQMVKPVDWLIRDWPSVDLGSPQAKRFIHGQTVMMEPTHAAGMIRVFDAAGAFLGTGRIDAHHMLHPHRLRAFQS